MLQKAISYDEAGFIPLDSETPDQFIQRAEKSIETLEAFKAL